MMFEPRNPDYREAVRLSFSEQTAMKALGAELSVIEPGRTVIGFQRNANFLQQHGYMHAGASTTVVDSACGYAALSLLPAGSEVVTVEFKVNFIRPLTGKNFRAEGRVVSSGRRISVCEGEVTDTDSGRIVTRMQATMMAVDPA